MKWFEIKDKQIYFNGHLLNRAEMLTGAALSSSFAWFYSWFFIPVILLSAFLWALGGSYKILIRRIGVPLVIILGAYLGRVNFYWVFLSFPAAFAVSTIGYGIPCEGDKGSPLGRFWCERLGVDLKNGELPSKEDDRTASTLSRATIAFLFSLSLWSFGFVNPYTYVCGILCAIVSVGIINYSY